MGTKVYLIALNTFHESVRSKVMYSLLFFALAMLVASLLFGSVTIGDRIVVLKDFGLFSISLFSALYAVISGTALLHKELSRRTIYNILAKSVRRWEFVFGKYLGMLLTTAVMVACMCAALLAFVYLLNGEFSAGIVRASLHIVIELMVVCAFAIFFSSIVVTPLLAGMLTFAVFLAARSTEYLMYFVNQDGVSAPLSAVLKSLYALLPHLDRVNISDLVVYDAAVSWSLTFYSFAHAAAYSGVLLILSTWIFSKRDFN
ncbi:MAG: ABC transporter permease [Oligoflexia bacterium]|nr:ABC transporter permease [Oligoflexia bacterium]